MIGFALLATVMIVGALGVVLLRQPVHAALSLVGTLLALAVTYVTLQAHFLAAVQVIVYAGAIMVLFLFVIMLLNVGDATGPKRSLPWLRWAAYGAGVVAAAATAVAVFLQARPAPDADVVRQALGGGGAGAIGDVLFGEFLLPFHLVGVLLLTGVIGAVALVQRRAETAHGLPARRPGDDGPTASEPGRALGSGGRS
jgi:NADH-quinone oxidoreductase subunit J